MNEALCLVGPTGIGKTAVALEIARITDVEIISADSRQIYKYLNIGTAKPSTDELQATPHHFIDILDPSIPYSAGQFAREARIVMDQIIHRKKLPLIAGGAGFYIQALIDGLSAIDISTDTERARLKERWGAGESDAIFDELRAVDPQSAAHLKKNDKQRIIRALEVYLAGKKRLSDLHKIKPLAAEFRVLMFGLMADRSSLYKRINDRVDEMLRQGLIDEVKGLVQMGYDQRLNALNTVGYKEVFEYLDHKLSYEQMVGEIKKNSRRYAKRQLTWFRRDNRIQWLDTSRYPSACELAEQIIRTFQHAGKG
jgi:tRNA dimethylallyltransferase